MSFKFTHSYSNSEREEKQKTLYRENLMQQDSKCIYAKIPIYNGSSIPPE